MYVLVVNPDLSASPSNSTARSGHDDAHSVALEVDGRGAHGGSWVQAQVCSRVFPSSSLQPLQPFFHLSPEGQVGGEKGPRSLLSMPTPCSRPCPLLSSRPGTHGWSLWLTPPRVVPGQQLPSQSRGAPCCLPAPQSIWGCTPTQVLSPMASWETQEP